MKLAVHQCSSHKTGWKLLGEWLPQNPIKIAIENHVRGLPWYAPCENVQTQLLLPETKDRGTNESKECQHFRQVPWSVLDSKGNQPRRGWNNVDEHELTRLSCFVQGSCRSWPHTRAEDAWSKVHVEANEPNGALPAGMALTSKAPIWWRLPLPSGDLHLSSFHLPPFSNQFFDQALNPNGWRQKSQSQSCLRNEKNFLLGAGNNSWRTRK